MSRLNVPAPPPVTHERGPAHATDSGRQLRRSVLTCLLWEDTFYETGTEIATGSPNWFRRSSLRRWRTLPLRLVIGSSCATCLSFSCANSRGARGPARSLKRPLAMSFNAPMNSPSSWPCTGTRSGSRWPPGVKRGLAAAFGKFDEYRLAKYDRASKIKLRDVLFLVHAKPKDDGQAALWKRLVDGELATPDTWEVELSAGKDKKETFERLLRQGKLGGLAVLRNLRNMQQAGVDEALIRARLDQGIARALPFRFVTAAGFAPNLEDALEVAMLKGTEDLPPLPGKTGLLVDVSGSMDERIATEVRDDQDRCCRGSRHFAPRKGRASGIRDVLEPGGCDPAAPRLRLAGRHQSLAAAPGHVPPACAAVAPR